MTKSKSNQDKNINTNQTDMDKKTNYNNFDPIIKLAKRRVGLYPVSLNHIRKHSDVKNDDDVETFNGEHYDVARHNAAIEYLEVELRFYPNEVQVNGTKVASNKESMILWIETTESNVRKIFSRVASLSKDKNLKIYNYFPRELWARKISLEHNCKIASESNKQLRTQIRIGEHDIQLYTKMTNEKYWMKTPNEAYGALKPIGVDHMATPKKDRSEEQTNKRAARSPIDNQNNKKQKDSTPGKVPENDPNEVKNSNVMDEIENTTITTNKTVGNNIDVLPILAPNGKMNMCSSTDSKKKDSTE